MHSLSDLLLRLDCQHSFQGHISAVVISLLSLKDYLSVGVKTVKSPKFPMSQRSVWKLPESNRLGPMEDDDGRWNVSELKFHATPKSPVMLGMFMPITC